MKQRKTILLFSYVTLILLLVGCRQFEFNLNDSQDEGGSEPTNPVNPASAILIQGESLLLQDQSTLLRAVYEDSSLLGAPQVSWEVVTSESQGAGSITSTGSFVGTAPGEVVVRATPSVGDAVDHRVMVHNIILSSPQEMFLEGDTITLQASVEPNSLTLEDVGFSWNLLSSAEGATGEATGALGASLGEYELTGVSRGSVLVEGVTTGGAKSITVQVGAPFILTYRIPSGGTTVALPLYDSDSYDLLVLWEGESTLTHVRSTADTGSSYYYSTAGDKRVEIWATSLEGFTFGPGSAWSYPSYDTPSAARLIDVQQFGSVRFVNNPSIFAFCYNLSGFTATDAPYLEGDGSNMFWRAESFNHDISHWDVSRVTNMSQMFTSASAFNASLNEWDVSSVTNMNKMFQLAISFNQPLSGWDVSNVRDVGYLFREATNFNQNLSSWNLSSATNLSGVFYQATNFNNGDSGNNGAADLTWTIGAVQTMDWMFFNATSFNQNTNSWTVSGVTNMARMFQGASIFNQPLDSWSVSSVADMSWMFFGASAFNRPLNGWNVDSVTTMRGMFYNAVVFNQDLSGWDLQGVGDLRSVLYGATAFTQDMSGWTNWTRQASGVQYDSFLVNSGVTLLPPGFADVQGN